jgi:hypothetical protein
MCEVWITGGAYSCDNFETSFFEVVSRRLRFVHRWRAGTGESEEILVSVTFSASTGGATANAVK